MGTQPIRKAERIEAYVKSFGLAGEEFEPCYLAYFVCFNTQEYYEAHDVLEHLWLQREDENHAFFKGLIQLAGAFVHLKKQSVRPWHPTDGRRMRPAVRLFALAKKNLSPYAPQHMGLDVSESSRTGGGSRFANRSVWLLEESLASRYCAETRAPFFSRGVIRTEVRTAAL